MPRSGGPVGSPEGGSGSQMVSGILVPMGVPASASQARGWAPARKASSAVYGDIVPMPPLSSYIRRRTVQPSRLISSTALRQRDRRVVPTVRDLRGLGGSGELSGGSPYMGSPNRERRRYSASLFQPSVRLSRNYGDIAGPKDGFRRASVLSRLEHSLLGAFVIRFGELRVSGFLIPGLLDTAGEGLVVFRDSRFSAPGSPENPERGSVSLGDLSFSAPGFPGNSEGGVQRGLRDSRFSAPGLPENPERGSVNLRDLSLLAPRFPGNSEGG